MAPDPSAKKAPLQEDLTKMKGQKNFGKGCATTRSARVGIFPENLRRPTLSRIRMEYMSFDGTVTMLLRVVASQTLCDDRWILKTPKP